jgi:hypothetical protein
MPYRDLLDSNEEPFDPDIQYTDFQLEEFANQLLRKQSRSIVEATGKERGIGGEDPILFEEHLYARKRREIYPESGTPDPSLVSGIYYRSHPEGRKINSPEARKKHGASYYRG